MNAALQLGLTDPEDSDVNAIFEGIRVYDELKSQGIDAQIASISGNRRWLKIRSDPVSTA
jgi:putative membrane protein